MSKKYEEGPPPPAYGSDGPSQNSAPIPLKQHICILLPRLNLNINSSHINNHTRKVNTRNKANNTLNKGTHHKEDTMRQVRRWDISNNLHTDTNNNLMDINRDMVNSREVLLPMAFWELV
ncbi:uncharacterized protein Bfra_003917ia [Botrytis fragariae]|uniref:Uncharacterized protein n=1 Tax=Botrytis fragariae TaxID=1964551 RepID=A0A8H6EKD3_9HELO|nr:uncharacterized protein Bfra_003917ia [Botrytis fragariae]KAF5875463.1 hypothetical protein Bfra_003917ia [Botrytis fragariae]